MNVSKEDLEEILERVFEEGYYGYLDLKESVVQATIAELKEKEEEKGMTLVPEQLEFNVDFDGSPVIMTGTDSGSLVINGGYSVSAAGDTTTTLSTYANTTNTYANTANTYATSANSFLSTANTTEAVSMIGQAGGILTNTDAGARFVVEGGVINND